MSDRSSIVRLPIPPPRLTNDPRHEFIFAVCEGLPPVRQKRLVMMARDPQLGLLTDTDAEILIDALGLKEV